MVVALPELFVALGGTGVAAKNGAFKVRSQNIVNGQVKTPDLANNAVTGAKIRNGQVSGADLGADINEATLSLGGLDAQTFDGAQRCAKSVRLQPDAVSPLVVKADLCQIGPFTIEAECEAESDPGQNMSLIVKVVTTENGSFFGSTADTAEWKPLPELNTGGRSSSSVATSSPRTAKPRRPPQSPSSAPRRAAR